MGQNGENHSVQYYRIGLFLSPGVPPTLCWSRSDVHGVVLAPCDAASADQHFSLTKFHFLGNGGKCLEASDEGTRWAACNATAQDQYFSLWKRGGWGAIANCCAMNFLSAHCHAGT